MWVSFLGRDGVRRKKGVPDEWEWRGPKGVNERVQDRKGEGLSPSIFTDEKRKKGLSSSRTQIENLGMEDE